MQHNITDQAVVRELITAGKNTFTLVSKNTGVRYTYKIVRKESDRWGITYFVSLFTGTDNTYWEHYTTLGILNPSNGQIRPLRNPRIDYEATSFKAIRWFLAMLWSGTPITTVEYWHEGRCARCGKVLTVPSSIAAGLGPECAGR